MGQSKVKAQPKKKTVTASSKDPKPVPKRKTPTDLDLWTRRFESIKLYAQGYPVGQIALQLHVDPKTVWKDMQAYQIISKEFTKSGINRLELTLEEAKRQAFNKLSGAEPGASAQLLRVIVEITKEQAILTGRRRVEGTGTVNVSQQVAAGDFTVKEKVKIGGQGLKRLADFLADPTIEEALLVDQSKTTKPD